MNDQYDYGEYEDDAPAEDTFAELARLALELRQSEREVAKAVAAAKEAEKRYKEIAYKTLPEFMESIGLTSFEHEPSGVKIVIEEHVQVSLPKKEPERYANGIEWLEDNKYGKALKRTVSAEFGKGKEAEAKAFAKRLNEEGHAAKFEKTIHPSTLKSLIKERLASGEPVPEDLFGVHQGKVAKIK
jgi:hypothetical protein